MNVLITGALGHIGSKLIRSLPEFFNICAVDNLATNRYCSLFNLNRDINFIEDHFINISEDVLESANIIIHLAAVTDAVNSSDDGIEETNVYLTKAFIDNIKQVSEAKVIFPSSTSVYGVATDVVTEDDDGFLNPQSLYAEAKIEIENYIKSSGINYTILRLATIFGVSPGIRFHTAINKFCYQAAMGQKLTVWKQNYDQFRPYLGLNDCSQAFCRSVLDINTDGQVFNVLSDNYKLSDIITYMKKVIYFEVEMINTPLLNQYSYKVSSEKFKNLGFIPKDHLNSAIKNTVGLFK